MHTICFLFGHDWGKEHEWDPKDDYAPKHLCATCGKKDIPGIYFGDLYEGLLPFRINELKIWACGFFLGHKWWSAELGDSGDWEGGCERCEIVGSRVDDEPEYNIFVRMKTAWKYRDWP